MALPAGLLSVRGTVEGFYGPPWTHEQRLAHLEFSARVGLNAYVYAPKHDPLHRQLWREPYGAGQLRQFAELVSGVVTGADARRASASYRRRIVLWDNFPVNDHDPSRLFLGPLSARAADLAADPVAGVLANPMIEALPSRIPLATVADWATNPAGYSAAASAAAALQRVAQSGAGDLAPFVRACSSWPPSAARDAELTAATAAALHDDAAALHTVASRLSELATACRRARTPPELITQLRPWLDSAIRTAEAGLSAVELLRAADRRGAEHRMARYHTTERLLTVAESRYHDVLRPVVHPFVRAVLRRTAPSPPVPTQRPVALLASGADGSAGDAATARFLEAAGFAVHGRSSSEANGARAADVVVITPSTPRDQLSRLAGLAVPIVAWSGFRQLRLANRAATGVLWNGLTIRNPADPLAAGHHGTVAAHRGPGWITTAAVAGRARVVAEAPDGERAALFRYAPGDPLIDGTPAPAARIGLFLGNDGPAHWLLSPVGRELVAAAFSVALS